ncbi:DegQ family serine endoprotease [Pseudomonas syringae pv. coryli]|uniref:Probable periplasmic serine endoprotease DegP-like n=2 Tax=Pseudomonas syringae group TaxID=136849 RepID=A0A0P9MI65_9PSED|nr:DegQ family serine endoprotease [Pseudomonas syringae pv. coryli]KPW88271.1 Peptidase S1, chymotrypsin:PDZ/DHR/GLGF [Pseudomonas syringae pv. coryli]
MFKALRFFGWPLLAGVLIAMLIIQRYPQWVGLPSLDVNLQQAPQTTNVMQGPSSYADAVIAAAPAVVNLYTTKMVNKGNNPLFEDPQFRRFFGDNTPKQKRMESSLGSGVMMSPEGYILTNNHVTTGADQIVVALKDGRETIARVIGNDPETDLAVLKIDLKNLPAITIARSDSIRIGDVALAIGNPFGVGQTVTMGIISATGRNQLGLNTYEDFIQTDAAINPGNSGGPLFNMAGEVVGINSQIFTRSGGFMGLSFAIPIDVAMDVANQLKANGKVSRGWLGVVIQEVNKDLAESFGLDKPAGALVAQVLEDGPAAKGGVQVGDVILSANGQPIVMSADLPHLIGNLKDGSKAELEVIRDGKRQKLTVTVGALPDEGQEMGDVGGTGAERSSNRLGVSVIELTAEQKKSLDLKGGVAIKEVTGGPASLIGLQSGDVITHLNNQAITSSKQFTEVAKSLPKDRSVSMRVLRQGRATFITFKLSE